MKSYAVLIVAVLAAALLTPLRAADAEKGDKAVCKTMVVTADDESGVVTCTGDDNCKIIVKKDGKQKVIKIKGGSLLGAEDDLDAGTHVKLLDARIAHLKATSQLKTELAIKRLEAEKLELEKKSEADVTAKKKEMNALKAKLADAKLDYEQAVKKLVPEGTAELYLLGDEMSVLDLCLPEGLGKHIIKKIELRGDGEED